jgi:hypothetical protein
MGNAKSNMSGVCSSKGKPARGSNINPLFSLVLSVFCPNGSDLEQLFFWCCEIS